MTDHIVLAECCRLWSVNPLTRWPRCPQCGKTPTIQGAWAA